VNKGKLFLIIGIIAFVVLLAILWNNSTGYDYSSKEQVSIHEEYEQAKSAWR